MVTISKKVNALLSLQEIKESLEPKREAKEGIPRWKQAHMHTP